MTRQSLKSLVPGIEHAGLPVPLPFHGAGRA